MLCWVVLPGLGDPLALVFRIAPMRLTPLMTAAAVGALLTAAACTPSTGGGSSTTAPPTTPTTEAPQPLEPFEVSGTADKTVGCFSGLLGDDNQEVNLGSDGWWNFGFQGCSLGATETVALLGVAPHVADGFKAPTGYECKLAIAGTSDETPWYTNQIGSTADTGGKVFLSSSSAWPNTTTWTITCRPLTPIPM